MKRSDLNHLRRQVVIRYPRHHHLHRRVDQFGGKDQQPQRKDQPAQRELGDLVARPSSGHAQVYHREVE